MEKGKRKRWILATLIIANAMIFLDALILPVALPTIQRMLGSSTVQLQWMVNSYLLALGLFVAVGGKLGDHFGHRKVFILGMLIFGLFSAFCGLSVTSTELIVNRFFQGVGSALMIPTSLALLCESFPENYRVKALGIVGSVCAIFIALAPLIGGFITEYFSWHYIFFINVPVAAYGLLLTFTHLSKSRRSGEKLDLLGFVTFVIALFCLTVAIMQGRVWGWDSLPILFLFSLSALAFLAYWFSFKRAKRPFLDFTLFKKAPFFCAAVIIFAASFAKIITFFWVIFFQDVRGMTPFHSGALTTIATLPIVFLTPYAGRLATKYGPKVPIVIGQSIMAGALVWLAFWMPVGKLVLTALGLLAFGFGLILVMNAANSSGLSELPKDGKRKANSLLSTLRHMGAVFGLAILGSIFVNLSENLEAMAFKESYGFSISIINFVAAFVVILSLATTLILFKPKPQKKKELFSLEP
ncbi:MAG: Multidrug resistance protein Stp [Chlamydiae bacterium]|nr:Multidrug resistance protein Stp [Chlamydiota bacterium]